MPLSDRKSGVLPLEQFRVIRARYMIRDQRIVGRDVSSCPNESSPGNMASKYENDLP